MAQVALAWLLHQTAPITPIIGARKVSQLQDNLASLDLELSAEQLKSLYGASGTRLVAPSNGANNPDHWSAEGISTPGQSRQFGSGTLRRTIEIPRWRKWHSPGCSIKRRQ